MQVVEAHVYKNFKNDRPTQPMLWGQNGYLGAKETLLHIVRKVDQDR